MSERRWCKHCKAETLHDVFSDAGCPAIGKKASIGERIFFGLATQERWWTQ